MQTSFEVPELAELATSLPFLAVAGGSLLLVAFLCCRVVAKAGYPAAMGLLMLVPGVNLVLLGMLGFGRWPIERELRSYRQVQRAVHKADAAKLRRVA